MRYRFVRFPEGRCKAVTLSYDDGSTHDRHFLEIINQHGLKCTFNINSKAILRGDSWRISSQEVYDLHHKYGHEVAVHGAKHIALGRATAVNGIRDVLECRLELEKLMKCIIRGMAYPDSGITKLTEGLDREDIYRYVEQLGILYARTLRGDNDSFDLPDNWYAWMPTCHHQNPKLMEYVDKFLTEDPRKAYMRESKLFYLWGHSFEFENNNNWELLEEFGRRMGGHQDIWYATNIEICEYVRAYHQLVFSVDNDIVYNPTIKKIWFATYAAEYCIEPGQTLYISEE